MSDKSNVLIKSHEGYRDFVYDDATGEEIVSGTKVIGNPTIGWGRLLTKGRGIDLNEAEMLFNRDIEEATSGVNALFDWYKSLDDVRAGVVLSMVYNLGMTRFLKFKKTIAAIEAGNWEEAALQILDSNAARQLPTRYKELAEMMRTGDI